MAKTYNTIGTFTAGQVLTAAEMNELGENSNNYRVPPMVKCRYASGTTLLNGNLITIGWNAADDYDTDSMHDPATNNSRITINTDGIYLVTFALYATSAFTNTLEQIIRLDGSTRVADSSMDAGAAQGYGFTQTLHISLTAGQYLEAQVFHASGANKTPQTTPPCFFAAAWIGQAS